MAQTIPDAVFQRVLLLREQNFGNAMHMLEWYGKMPAAPPQTKRFALVHPDPELLAEDKIRVNLSILSSVATVIDLANTEAAAHRIAIAASEMWALKPFHLERPC